MIRRTIKASIVALALAGATFANADEKVTATAVYYAPLSMSPAQARQEAITRAQLDAIRTRFGSSLTETNFTFMQESSDGSRDDFYAIGESDVKGEWVETLGDTVWNITPGAHETIYEVTLRGRIREIPTGRADIDSRILFNGTDRDRDRLRNFTFHVGDYIYVYFTSPVDGYLAAYLGDDDEAMTMQCLLPYDGMADGAFPIEAGKEYILFSRDDATPEARPFTRRIKMNARKDVDINQIYIIFSPNKFTKAADVQDRSRTVTDRRTGEQLSLLPRQATFAAFQKWLARNRRHDPQMQVIKTVVSVRH